MTTETLKIKVAQKILSVSNESLLKKIDDILNTEGVFGFDGSGNAISNEAYKLSLDYINNEINEGKAELYSTKDVLKTIINDNKLAQ